MLKIKIVSQSLFFHCILSQLVVGQGVPSTCKEFRDLLAQPGLKITAQPQRAVLFPGEVLEPIINIHNTSDRIVTIPVIDVNSGIITLALKRKINPISNQYDYLGHLEQNTNFKPLEGKEFCSFPTLKLEPKETKSFPMQFPNQMWAAPRVMPRMSPNMAFPDEGKNAFDMYLGNIRIRGYYDIEAFDKIASICIRETESMAIDRRPSRSNQDTYCSLVTLVKQQSKWYLISARGPASLSSHLNELRLRTNAARPNQTAIVLYPEVGQIIAEFDSEPEIQSRRFPQDISASEFILNTRDGIKSFNDLQSVYKKRLQTSLDKLK